jgi:glycosyltransferase involved in cell wall biosynthesis
MEEYCRLRFTYEEVDAEMFGARVKDISARGDIVIYGAGHHGKLICEYLEQRAYHAAYFCDGDSSKHNTAYCGKRVVSPSELFEKYVDETIIVSAYKSQREIHDFLLMNGIRSECIVLPAFRSVQGELLIPPDALPVDCVGKCELRPHVSTFRRHKIGKSAPNILVSTSVYNVRASYLRRAIESVLNQTFPYFRYLIADNGSTDGSADIIREYAEKDSRIEVYTLEKNYRLARIDDPAYAKLAQESIRGNYKMRESLYEYICILDSDDYYEPDFLEITYALAKQYDADIVAGRTQLYKEDAPSEWQIMGSPLETNVYKGKNEIAPMFLEHAFTWCVVWAKLMKFSIYLRNGFPVDAYTDVVGDAADVFANFVRLDLSEIIVLSNKCFHHCTIRPDSQSKTMRQNSRAITRMYFLYDWLMDFLDRANALCEKNITAANDFIITNICHPDLTIIRNTMCENSKLTADVIKYILQQKIPEGLRQDMRMKQVLDELEKILVAGETKASIRSAM